MTLDQPKKFLEIIKDGSINPLFLKANRFLINLYNEDLISLPDEDKREFIKDLWNKHYHASVIHSKEDLNKWEYLDFFSEKDMMLFLMKWDN